jgi:hypothetical protein
MAAVSSLDRHSLGHPKDAVRHRALKVSLDIIPAWLEKLTSSDVWRSDLAAWWGAIIGTVALGWNILRNFRPKGRVKVEGIYQVADKSPLLRPVFAVRVTNIGSRPILFQGIAIQLKKGSKPSHHFFPCESPMMLARGMFFLQVIDRTGWLPTGAEKLYAWDSGGEHWYLARKDFRRLIDQHRRFIADESERVAAV